MTTLNNHKLINTGSYLLVVSDDEIKDGDWVYDVITTTTWLWEKYTVDEIDLKYKNKVFKIIAHLPLNNSPILQGVDLLPPLEQEDDVEKLANEYAVNDFDDYAYCGFISGYNKAKEKYFKPIPEWVYTGLCTYDNRNPYYLPYDEDDITKKPTDCSCDNCFYGRTKMAEFILSIQSLSQPKLPVAFKREMELCEEKCSHQRCKHNGCQNPLHGDTFKTTTNSQGQTFWVGEYIY